MPSSSTTRVAGLDIPTRAFYTLIVGSGAAGLNCAEHLYELGVTDIAVVTSQLGGGTSANSGSDKQTYYKIGVFGDAADSPLAFARTLTAGGMCHGDLAYIEALGSLPEFFHLVRNGVGFPHNEYGAYVGYKTDHDPLQRATSAGPKTSVQMVAHSLANVRRNGTEILDGLEVIRLLVDGPSWRERRVVGALAVDKHRLDTPMESLVLLRAHNTVLATGGPGEMYATSVYPPGQVGSHGLALEIGCAANNLTESQFGLASVGFRWNLSGTYQQVIPCYFSTDANGGDVRYFLNDYYPTMRQVASSIFLKGYQWPFHAERLQSFGSSLVDIAVFEETRLGRRVYMDFTRNPVPTGAMSPFSLEELEPEAGEYLARSGAVQETPYRRLQHMNPLAIEVYEEHEVDLRDPLEVAVCSQHCNGGLTVDTWWRTTVPGLFAIGEVAGTHGVRPGGSALNAGQVGGLRAAQLIAHRARDEKEPAAAATAQVLAQVEAEVVKLQRYLSPGADAPAVDEVRAEIQERMSEHAAFVRRLEGVCSALGDARALAARIAAEGQRPASTAQIARAFQNEHLCRTHIAFLVAIKALLERGGGSRGAYVVLDEAGDRVLQTAAGTVMPHRGENMALRREILEVGLDETGQYTTWITPVRPLPADDSWYESVWRHWRDGEVFEV